jgi:hypothetical protein
MQGSNTRLGFTEQVGGPSNSRKVQGPRLPLTGGGFLSLYDLPEEAMLGESVADRTKRESSGPTVWGFRK